MSEKKLIFFEKMCELLLAFCNEEYEEIHHVAISRKKFEEIWISLKYGNRQYPFWYGTTGHKWIEQREKVENLFYSLIDEGFVTIGSMSLCKFLKKVRISISHGVSV